MGENRGSKLDLSRNHLQPSDDEEEDQQFLNYYSHPHSQAKSLGTHKTKRSNLASKQDCNAKSLALKPLKLKNMRGVIVEVGGDRILRSTGRKDRHSKVCTSRGLRDRRVRLSPNTAVQFYDVQDRLGFERPSEAIDWLMNKAKASIEALDTYPPAATQPEQNLEVQSHEDPSLFVPPSSADFRSLLHDPDFRSRSQIQGFSFSGEPSLSSSPAVHFEATPTNWSNLQTLQISGNGGGRGGFVANSAPQWQQTVFLEQNQLFSSQGGTLQSSYPPPSFPAGVDDLNYDQLLPIGASWGNIDGFTGAQASPRIRGEGEKQIPVPSNQSSATCLLHYPY